MAPFSTRQIDGSPSQSLRVAPSKMETNPVASSNAIGSGSRNPVPMRRGAAPAAPGFIDAHTHIEGGVERNPRGDNFLLDGVTTVITGNCGSSELNLAAWAGKLAQLGLGLNVATLVVHNSVRREVMGTAKRQAT